MPSPAIYADLTVPAAGSTTGREVLSHAVRRLVGDLSRILRQPTADPLLRADLAGLARAFAAMPDRAGALSAVLRRANVAVLVRCARDGDPALVPELVATLAVELAVLGALPAPVELRCLPPRLVSLAGRFALDLPAGATLVASSREIRVRALTFDPRDPRGVERPFVPVVGDVVLALADQNPLSMLEAHPNKAGNRIDLGGRSADEWCASLREALARIERHLPELRAEFDLHVQQLVPVGYDPEAHLSASYREAIGTIYLTLHPQPMTMTEALIHEFSHGKLNALFEVDEVLRNDPAAVYKSPVRPDPRPLHGVLLAAHAFVPVARLYEAMLAASDPLAAHPSFAQRFAQIVASNHEGISLLLAHADPTPAGRALLDELARWDAHYSASSAVIAARTPAVSPGPESEGAGRSSA
ncbi:MAG: hypothetical protein IPJ34_18095 [Myxococcales bacterium]|nr:hypothetical protein [Myxococcales bacterium]